jgi:hypothetical protein
MATEQAEWERSTPEQLVPAIKRIRELFDTGAWKCSELTRHLCYASLHPQEAGPTSLVPYTSAFATYRRMISSAAQQQFDDLLSVGTPPSVFRAYLDVHRQGLEVDVRDQFDQILQVGIANVSVLRTHPVEWAKSHLQLLVNGNAYRVKIWIKEVCDKRDLSGEGAEKEFDDVIYWRSWRAPQLIHMEPSGNTRYSLASAWTREDEPRTEELLGSLAKQFTQFLGIYLHKVAGDAHVRVAQRTPDAQTPPRHVDHSLKKTVFVTKAPPPVSEVGGRGEIHGPKATEVLSSLPVEYPSTLVAQSHLIIVQAVRKFPIQTQTLELCKYVISELTPHFREALQNKVFQPDQALSRMQDLLHYLLVHNCDGEWRRCEIRKEVLKSDEWVALNRELLRIETVAIVKQRSAKRKPTEKSQRMEKARKSIQMLWTQNPEGAHKDITESADKLKVEVPWRNCNSWADAVAKHEGAVKTFLSKARANALSRQ